MSYIKSCNFCGQKISMREMRDGHWVAFDASTETAHQCGRKTKPDPSITALGAKNKKKEEPGGIDIGYHNVDVPKADEQPNVWIDPRARVPENKKIMSDINKIEPTVYGDTNEEDIAKYSPSMPEWVPIVIWVVVLLVIFLFTLN